MDRNPPSWGLLAIITACVLWGASFYFGKVALVEISADQVVLWRFVLALIVLAPFVGLRAFRQSRRARPEGLRRPAPIWRAAPWLLLNGLLTVPVQFVLQFEGLARTTASSAALIVGAFAPMMAIAAVLIAKERLGTIGWVAVACSTLGLMVMVGAPGEGRTLTGDVMVLASLVAAVGMVLVTQRLVRHHDALWVTLMTMAVGTVLLIPWTLWQRGLPSLALSEATWAALLGLGLGCTALTFTLWNWGLRYVPASHAGVFVNLEPVIGAVLGVAFLGDVMTPALILGGGLILGAALLVSWPTSTPASAPAQADRDEACVGMSAAPAPAVPGKNVQQALT
ncbi:MAG: DMT family transporter [Bacteroidota bacterium]